MKDILLITAPFTQLNTPYPATTYLKGFLDTKSISNFQMDLGFEVILTIFSKEGLKKIFEQNPINKDENIQRIYSLKENYINSIDEVIEFLQGKSTNISRKISTENYLPQAKRFDHIEELDFEFGYMSLHDKAMYLATLYLEDLSDYIRSEIDADFGFTRYAERLGRCAYEFDEIYKKLNSKYSIIENIAFDILSSHLNEYKYLSVGFSIPFPGNLYSTLRCCKWLKTNFPEMKIIVGGGFVNTELRNIKDKRFFETIDFLCLDKGELPLELIIKNIKNKVEIPILKRTFHLDKNEIVFNNFSIEKDYDQQEIGTPSYVDLKLKKYISVIEMTNPMHSLWTNGKWIKLTMAYGCYWKKCTFCDTSLNYIDDYEPIQAKLLVDKVEKMILETGENGFHFVDEAAPPTLMKEFALEILKRKINIIWWTNIRLEKSFTLDLCKLLQASGCIAVSGGLEVASDRLLNLINKGVTVAQVAQVTKNFTDTGLMVHAYLMYGFPTQSEQEIVDSLEMVRQLFQSEIVHSAFWHQFALTCHSPIFQNPEKYKIKIKKYNSTFAENDIPFTNENGMNYEKYDYGLKKALYNYMHHVGFEFPLQEFFEFKIPQTSIKKNFIEQNLLTTENIKLNDSKKIIWLGESPLPTVYDQVQGLVFHEKNDSYFIALYEIESEFICEFLNIVSYKNLESLNILNLKKWFLNKNIDFENFMTSDIFNLLKEKNLIVI